MSLYYLFNLLGPWYLMGFCIVFATLRCCTYLMPVDGNPQHHTIRNIIVALLWPAIIPVVFVVVTTVNGAKQKWESYNVQRIKMRATRHAERQVKQNSL